MKTKKELLELAKELEEIRRLIELDYNCPESYTFKPKFKDFRFELGFPTDKPDLYTLEFGPFNPVSKELTDFISCYFNTTSDKTDWGKEAGEFIGRLRKQLKEGKYTEAVELTYDLKKAWNKDHEILKAEIPYSIYKNKYWRYKKVENSYNAEKKTIKIYISKKKLDEDRESEARTVVAEVSYYDYRHKYYDCKPIIDSYNKDNKTIEIYIDSKRLEEKL